MADPLAYFLTWTTYGTWLPGDRRGWAKKKLWGVRPPDVEREDAARRLMVEEVVTLSSAQREIIDAVIVEHCEKRRWYLHARNVRTNHVHVVVTADVEPSKVQEQLKLWGSRGLSDHAGLVGAGKNGRRRWWTEGGDIEYVCDDNHLTNVIRYVMEQ